MSRPSSFGRPREPHKPTSSDLIFGKNAVTEALKASRRDIKEILVLTAYAEKDLAPICEMAKAKGIRVTKTDGKTLDNLATGHQNVIARVGKLPEMSLKDLLQDKAPQQLVVALDSVQDPQNFGTLCRSAICFGVRYIILPQDRVAPISAVTAKASAGAIEHLNIVRVTNLTRALNELKENGFWIYGASLTEKSESLENLKPAAKSVLVLGSEGDGIRRLVAETCDVLVKIPMHGGFDSLNVAQAGTVLMYDFGRKINSVSPS